MKPLPTRFESHLDLGRLPWFDVRDDRLILTGEVDHEIIDAHTHLALGYVRRSPVDLWKEHERALHYLPLERPIDLDLYANLNFLDEDKKRMKRDLTLGAVTRGDARVTHTAANLLREMDELGISRAFLMPIDFPLLSKNSDTYIETARRDGRLHSFASVHPFDGNPGEKLERFKSMGALGMKMHPAIQTVAPDHDRAIETYRICGELGLPVLWHCGPVGIEPWLGRRLSQVKHYWRPVLECRETTFILGHSGALQLEMALELSCRHTNVHLDLSCQGLSNVKRILAEAPPERIVFGSDWPFYHQGPALAKALIATEGDEPARRRILFENAARLFDLQAEGRPAADGLAAASRGRREGAV